jgi:hypothetical protein
MIDVFPKGPACFIVDNISCLYSVVGSYDSRIDSALLTRAYSVSAHYIVSVIQFGEHHFESLDSLMGGQSEYLLGDSSFYSDFSILTVLQFAKTQVVSFQYMRYNGSWI